MRKLFVSLAMTGVWAGAVEISSKPFGYLTSMYNSQPNAFGFQVRNGIEFNFDESGIYAGLGAIGLWEIPTNSDSFSVGDISDAYFKYKRSIKHKDDPRETLEVAIGRFNSDFMMNDWLDGNMQGIAARYCVSDLFNLYGAWVDSMLGTGYKQGQIGAINGVQLAGLTPYSQAYKKANIGGEVLMVGLNFTDRSKWLIDVFGLLNTKLPGGIVSYSDSTPGVVISNKPQRILTQVGMSASYRFELAENFDAKTVLRGILQYGNTDGRDANKTGENASFLLWGDEQVHIFDGFYVGAGVHYIGGREGTGGIWALTDSTRYYGNTLGRGNNLLTGVAPYFLNNTITAYFYSGMDYNNIKIHALISFLDYQEIHLLAQGQVWSGTDMHLEVGGGFVSYKAKNAQWSSISTLKRNVSSNNFIVFARFAY
ncbi:MAG: hypothetical protein PUJ79_03485 [Helicobacter sp.]|nr:hypothetical protein [Helicobacter sp.]MDY5740360.1 hypothetical protein [Helicobacter sp.]